MLIDFKVRCQILFLLTFRRIFNYLRHLTHLNRPLCDCGYETVSIISQIVFLIKEQKYLSPTDPCVRLLALIRQEAEGGICHKADIETCECRRRAAAGLSAVRLLVFGFNDWE